MSAALSRRLFGLSALSPLVLATGAKGAAPAVTTIAPGAKGNVAVVRRFLEEVVNGGHIDLVDELWAPDLYWRGASMGELHGRAAFKAALHAAVGGAFSHMHLDIQDIVAAGDKVVVRFTNGGVNSGPLEGHAPTHRFAKWEGIGIYQVRNHQIVRADFCEDMLGRQRMIDGK